MSNMNQHPANNPMNPAQWNDFNTAESQQHYGLIPADTIAPVRMTIKPGAYNDPSQGWDGGYATCNTKTGSVYLNCEFVVLEGEFAKYKLWQLIGLYSPKGPIWQNIGRSFIRGLLNSAFGLSDNDTSIQAQGKRRISHLADLDNLCFVAKIGVKDDDKGHQRNHILYALSADSPCYAEKAKCFLQQATPVNGTSTASSANPVSVPEWANQHPTK